MPLSTLEKKHYKQRLSALRNSLQNLEEDLGLNGPVASKKQTKTSFKKELENNFLKKTWGKPEHLKKKKTTATTVVKK